MNNLRCPINAKLMKMSEEFEDWFLGDQFNFKPQNILKIEHKVVSMAATGFYFYYLKF
jgi:hypothetical protein